jgi:hypothetical protein
MFVYHLLIGLLTVFDHEGSITEISLLFCTGVVMAAMIPITSVHLQLILHSHIHLCP